MKEEPRKKTKTEKKEGDKSYSDRARAKWFCSVFKLGFLQLICKASLIFKSDFRFSFTNYFKRKKFIWVKGCCGGV